MSDFIEDEKNKLNEQIHLVLANTSIIRKIICAYDTKPDNFTMGELRKEFSSATRDQPLCNQWWGILMLYPLIAIAEEEFKNKIVYVPKRMRYKLWIIRNALAHNNVSINEKELELIFNPNLKYECKLKLMSKSKFENEKRYGILAIDENEKILMSYREKIETYEANGDLTSLIKYIKNKNDAGKEMFIKQNATRLKTLFKDYNEEKPVTISHAEFPEFISKTYVAFVENYYDNKENGCYLQLMSESDFKNKGNKKDGELAIDKTKKILLVYRKNKGVIETHTTSKELDSLIVDIKNRKIIQYDNLTTLFEGYTQENKKILNKKR